MFLNTDYGDKKSVIKDISTEIFEEILPFMNTGIAPNIEKYASELIEVAHYYDIRQLTEECGSCIFKNIFCVAIKFRRRNSVC